MEVAVASVDGVEGERTTFQDECDHRPLQFRGAPMTVAGRVSVIATTRNSGTVLEPLLRSVRAQTYADVELIVVDNCSTDDTLEVAKRYADRVFEAGPERSAQRNEGVLASTGEHVLIVDSDMVLEPDVVAACVDAQRDSGAAAVVVPEDTIGQGFWSTCRSLERSCYEGDESIEAARFFVRKVFLKYGGYDENLTGPEDWDLPARMRLAGECITRGSAWIHHMEGRMRLGPHLHKKYEYGKAFGAYIRRHPELAARQLTIVRPAFVRHWRRLASRPGFAAGILFLKAAELAAGGMGLLAVRLGSRKT